MTLRILMHEAFAVEEVKAVRRAVSEYDEAAEVSATYSTKAVEPLHVILIFLGLKFAEGAVTAAGGDAYNGLKNLITSIRAGLQARTQMVIEDDAGLELILGPDTPVEALDALPKDIAATAGDDRQLRWNDADNSWQPPF